MASNQRLYMPLPTISYDDFAKIDIRVGKVVAVSDFPEARKPAYQFKIDFGPEIGIKQSSAQVVGAHTKEELIGTLVCCVVNFPPKQVRAFCVRGVDAGVQTQCG